MNRDRKIVSLTSAAHFLTHMSMLIFPAVVMPISRETGLPASEIFPAGFYMYLLYGVLALPIGFMADHVSKVTMLRVCMLGIGISSLVAGMTTSLSMLTVALAGLGLFCGIYHPVGLGLIAKEIKAQGNAHGINGVFGTIGEAAGPLSAGIALLFFDWRWVYIFTGVVGFCCVVYSYTLDIRERAHHEIEAAHGKEELDKNYLWYNIPLTLAMTFVGLTYRANLTALPAYFEKQGVSLSWLVDVIFPAGVTNARSGMAAIMVSSIFLFSMTGQYLAGKVADRMDLRWAYIIMHSCSLPFALLMSYASGAPLYFLAGLFVFFNLGATPVENSLVSKFWPRRWLSTAYGVKFTFTFGLGSIAVYEVAMIDKTLGLSWVYTAIAGQILMVALMGLWLLAMTRKMKRVAN